MMEYRKAVMEEAQIVCDIVQGTKAVIYPHYYTKPVVEFFGRLHSIDHIRGDIEDGLINVLISDGIIVGTGSHKDSHITRVYVLPEYEGRGFGSEIMEHLEKEIFAEYAFCELDASLPAAIFYEHRGYRTITHKKYDIGNGEAMIYEIMRKERPL